MTSQDRPQCLIDGWFLGRSFFLNTPQEKSPMTELFDRLIRQDSSSWTNYTTTITQMHKNCRNQSSLTKRQVCMRKFTVLCREKETFIQRPRSWRSDQNPVMVERLWFQKSREFSAGGCRLLVRVFLLVSSDQWRVKTSWCVNCHRGSFLEQIVSLQGFISRRNTFSTVHRKPWHRVTLSVSDRRGDPKYWPTDQWQYCSNWTFSLVFIYLN